MKIRNENFAVAFHWLRQNRGVKSQKHLAEIIGVSEDTISRIMKGNVDVSEDVIYKLNAAFDQIFNVSYLRGNDDEMLVENLKQETKAADQDPVPFIPTWADSFFDIMTQQIKDNEALNRELRNSISALTSSVASLNSVCTEMIRVLNSLKK